MPPAEMLDDPYRVGIAALNGQVSLADRGLNPCVDRDARNEQSGTLKGCASLLSPTLSPRESLNLQSVLRRLEVVGAWPRQRAYVKPWPTPKSKPHTVSLVAVAPFRIATSWAPVANPQNAGTLTLT